MLPSIIKKTALLTTLLAAAASCHTVVIVTGTEVQPVSLSDTPPTPEKSERQGSTAMGIVSLVKNPEPFVCKKKTPEVKITTNIADNVIHFFVGPVYTSNTVQLYCR